MNHSDIAPEGLDSDQWHTLPEVDGHVAQTARKLLASFDDDDVQVRLGAVWTRKGYPESGSLSPKVAPSSYRGSHIDEVAISATIVIPTYMFDTEQRETVEQLTADVEARHFEAEMQARTEAVAKAQKAAADAEETLAKAQESLAALTDGAGK